MPEAIDVSPTGQQGVVAAFDVAGVWLNKRLRAPAGMSEFGDAAVLVHAVDVGYSGRRVSCSSTPQRK
jgi:hypothetical protein